MAKVKVHRQIAEDIRTRILSGELAFGNRLPSEDALVEAYGAARGSVREALRLLEAEGLVRIIRGRGGGPVVTKPDLQPAASALATSLQLQRTTFRDLWEATRLIEVNAVQSLCKEHKAEDIEALNMAVANAAAALDADDPTATGHAAAHFHQTIVRRADNTTLLMLVRLLHVLVNRYYVIGSLGSNRQGRELALAQYRRLVELICAGDIEGATELWNLRFRLTIEEQDADAELRIYD